MKTRLLFVSLFLISVLVISGCAQMAPRQYITALTREDVLDMLNNCEMVEMQNSDAEQLEDISCDAFCAMIDNKVCIKQDYGYFEASINRWIFDTGGNCDTAYGSINNINEEFGSKLQCMCCSA